MKSTFKQFIKDNRVFTTFYLIWFLVHIFLIVTRQEGKVFIRTRGGGSSRFFSDRFFWPFEDANLRAYDSAEFIFYLVLPIILFVIWKLVGNDIIKFLKPKIKIFKKK